MSSTFPPTALESVNWNKLGLAVQDSVNGHVESTYSVATGEWSEPKFVQDPYMRIHGLSPALNYGQQAYEGLKAHRDPSGQILIFRPNDHASRLSQSAAYVSIPEIPQDLFMKSVKLVTARNAEWVPPHTAEALFYIRPLVFGSSGHLALTAPTEFTFAVFGQPGGTYHGVQPLPACVIEDFDRAAPRGTGGAKVGGNYAPVIRHTDKARAQGFHVTLHLDAQTRTCVEEFSTSGFIGIKHVGDSAIVVVPDSKNIVPSITSDSVLKLAESFGWKVEKREIPWSECRFFDEVVAVGTAASLLPIRLLARPSTGDKFIYGEKPGPCTTRLSDELRKVMRGTADDQFGWIDRVHESDLLLEELVKAVEKEPVATGLNGELETAEESLEQVVKDVEMAEQVPAASEEAVPEPLAADVGISEKVPAAVFVSEVAEQPQVVEVKA